MSKPAKPAESEAQAPAPKSKKKLIIIVAVLVVLLVVGGAAAYFLMKPAHPAKSDKTDEEAVAESTDAKLPPKYVEIGTFTANLMTEDADRVVQVAISLKVTKPELEEKIKAVTPEIQNSINLLLQSKYPSQLATVEGKQKLANEILAQIEFILGLRKSAPDIHSVKPGDGTETVTPAKSGVKEDSLGKKGVASVLFTSFIIQ